MDALLGYESLEDHPRITARLIVAGIGMLLVGLAGVCLLVSIPFTLAALPASMASSSALRLGLLMTMGIGLGLAIVAVWTGIACFLGKRWVRPIILILAGFGLALAVPTLIGMSLSMVNPPPMPTTMPALANGVRLATLGFSMLLYLGVPLAYLLAFRPRHVQLLLERLDPQRRWTDRLPVPLLGMVIATVILSIQLPLAAVMPLQPMLMGVAVSRMIAMVPMAILMGGMIFAAVQLYRQRLAGWWLAVGILSLMAASNFVNAAIYGTKIYDSAFGADVSAQVAQSPIGGPRFQLINQGVWIAVMMTGAIWVKRCCLYHKPANQSEQAIIGSASSPL